MITIKNFVGDYEFLSNFFPARMEYEGLIYLNAESAFQAQKEKTKELRKKYQNMNPMKAKELGETCDVREDWENIRDEVMYKIVKAKFSQQVSLRKKLVDTKDWELECNNEYGDIYWGLDNEHGLNKLGKILMQVRGEFANE